MLNIKLKYARRIQDNKYTFTLLFMFKQQDLFKRLLTRIFKFALTSGIATLVDYVIFLVLSKYFFNITLSNVISYSCGMFVNFYLQRRFIFSQTVKSRHALILSILFSLIGLALNTSIVYGLTEYTILIELPIVAKLIATGVVFFYNYFTKQYAFERRWFNE